MYLRGKYPNKHKSDIKDMLDQKTNGNGLVAEEEVTDIIKYMYNQDDATHLTDKMKDYYVS